MPSPTASLHKCLNALLCFTENNQANKTSSSNENTHNARESDALQAMKHLLRLIKVCLLINVRMHIANEINFHSSFRPAPAVDRSFRNPAACMTLQFMSGFVLAASPNLTGRNFTGHSSSRCAGLAASLHGRLLCHVFSSLSSVCCDVSLSSRFPALPALAHSGPQLGAGAAPSQRRQATKRQKDGQPSEARVQRGERRRGPRTILHVLTSGCSLACCRRTVAQLC
jgi:hypothetical protein